MKLDIPHKSQLGNNRRNDCGAAVLAMLIDSNATAVLEALNHPKDKPLSIHDLLRALASQRFGIPTYYDSTLDVIRVRAALSQRWPVIVLANYGLLPQSAKRIQFDGAHYFLAVGEMETAIYLHDPLAPEGEGFTAVSDATLTAMIRSPGWGNMPNQGIVLKRPFPVLPEPGQTQLLKPPVEVVRDMYREENERLKARVAELEKALRMSKMRTEQLFEFVRAVIQQVDNLRSK